MHILKPYILYLDIFTYAIINNLYILDPEQGIRDPLEVNFFPNRPFFN